MMKIIHEFHLLKLLIEMNVYVPHSVLASQERGSNPQSGPLSPYCSTSANKTARNVHIQSKQTVMGRQCVKMKFSF